ncbi:MAG: alpha/beta hydrolase [Nevskiales bacterium]|nr:alpha/beta hydrolase [Nevskiales bacterium]
MPKLRVDDFDLHYEEAGSGPPLLLLHGLGASLEDWEHQIPAFAEHFRVIAPDLRGFGHSGSGRRRVGVARYAADVKALMDALDIHGCRLVGHSMGGAISLQLTLDHPSRIERLVIANSVPSFKPQSARHYIEFLYRLVVMGMLGPARLAEIGAQRMFPDPADALQRRKLIERGRRNSRGIYLGALASLGRWSVLERLHELQMPVLVAASQHDYFGHAETVRFAHALPRGRLHWFKGAHHGLPMEQPAAFNQVVLNFLTGPLPRLRRTSHSAQPASMPDFGPGAQSE